MQKITPFLWFDGNAEEAMNLYVSVFKNSKVLSVTRNGDGGPGPKGSVMMATFQLEGQKFMALNGGPKFAFTSAISLFVDCDTQAEGSTSRACSTHTTDERMKRAAGSRMLTALPGAWLGGVLHRRWHAAA